MPQYNLLRLSRTGSLILPNLEPGDASSRVPAGALAETFRAPPSDRKRHIETSLRSGWADRPHHIDNVFGSRFGNRRQSVRSDLSMQAFASPLACSFARTCWRCDTSRFWPLDLLRSDFRGSQLSDGKSSRPNSGRGGGEVIPKGNAATSPTKYVSG